MQNFIVSTSHFMETKGDPYCFQCGSCGILGCGCWANCIALRCKHGDDLTYAYEQEMKDSNTYYEMLIILGIENPHLVDLEKVKLIAASAYPLVDGTITEGISYYYNCYKEEES